MSSQIAKIDVANAVMQRIDHESIRIRPMRYFVLRRAIWAALFAGTMLLAVFLLLALGYAVRNDIFSEYLSMPSGAMLFVRSLPLAGISLSAIAVGVSIMLARKLASAWPDFKPAQAFIAGAVFVVVVTALGGLGAPGQTPRAFALASFLSSSDPVKLTGTIESYENGVIVVQTTDGVKSVYVGTLPDGIGQGDEILLLGTERTGTVTPKAIRLLNKALLTQEELKADATVTEPIADVTAPAPVPKATQPAPAPAPKPVPAPTPEPTKTISITNVTSLGGTKYQVSWSANFALEKGYKLVWSLSPNPTYPANPDPGVPYYYFDSNAQSSGTGYVKNSMGAGTYYVRVCEYLGGSCGAYSNQVTVVFP